MKKWLAKAIIYLVLEIGALCGVPMRPEQIEQLMKMTERNAIQDEQSPLPPGEGVYSRRHS